MTFNTIRAAFAIATLAWLHSASATVAVPNPPLQVRQFVNWALAHETERLPNIGVLDKKSATLYLFDASGMPVAKSAVLLGSAHGDDSVPGIGNRKISEIRGFERTTPAGRFPTEPGLNMQDEDIVWVDYDAAISMHRVRALKGQRRLERLATASPADNRISYGCINVPTAFYDRWIQPGFGQKRGILFVLPESRSAHDQFRAPLDF